MCWIPGWIRVTAFIADVLPSFPWGTFRTSLTKLLRVTLLFLHQHLLLLSASFLVKNKVNMENKSIIIFCATGRVADHQILGTKFFSDHYLLWIETQRRKQNIFLVFSNNILKASKNVFTTKTTPLIKHVPLNVQVFRKTTSLGKFLLIT